MAIFNSIKSLLCGRLDVAKRFGLQREAISGTMSKFYVARDQQSGKYVGLKILDLEKTNAVESRFKGLNKPSEGEIALAMKHPRIVETYEYGTTTDGSPYIVMELIDGPGMNSLIVAKDKRLDGRRLRFVRQTAEALAAVHKAGFIHRDVCPRNLMLSKDCENLKLTDFGLTVPATPPFMAPGKRTGTPNYMAPELVRRRPTDQRVDMFAFGVTAYEICSFELPWHSGVTGLAAMSHDTTPTDIREYRPQIDPTLAGAIHACIEPDIERRCPSMDSFLQLIRSVSNEDAP
jgi:serine/threonine protein kinase